MSFFRRGSHPGCARYFSCTPHLASAARTFCERSCPLGVIAEGIMAYAQPLFDSSDGSIEQMNRAMLLAQACWNLALVSEDQRDAEIDMMTSILKIPDAEFPDLRQKVILPMIRRHYEMFPGMHARSKQTSGNVSVMPAPAVKYPGTSRNAPCPCGSGSKYKRCCGPRK